MAITAKRLLDAALICAIRQQYGYRGYESRKKTMAAMRRRCPGVAMQRRQQALERATAVYRRAEQLVSKCRDLQSPVGLSTLKGRLRREYKDFSVSTVSEAIHWAYYWCVLR